MKEIQRKVDKLLNRVIPPFLRGMMSDTTTLIAEEIASISNEFVERKIDERLKELGYPSRIQKD